MITMIYSHSQVILLHIPAPQLGCSNETSLLGMHAIKGDKN